MLKKSPLLGVNSAPKPDFLSNFYRWTILNNCASTTRMKNSNSYSITLCSSSNRQVINPNNRKILDQLLWAIVHKLDKWETSTVFQPSNVYHWTGWVSDPQGLIFERKFSVFFLEKKELSYDFAQNFNTTVLTPTVKFHIRGDKVKKRKQGF